jgi:hypothetical protein
MRVGAAMRVGATNARRVREVSKIAREHTAWHAAWAQVLRASDVSDAAFASGMPRRRAVPHLTCGFERRVEVVGSVLGVSSRHRVHVWFIRRPRPGLVERIALRPAGEAGGAVALEGHRAERRVHETAEQLALVGYAADDALASRVRPRAARLLLLSAGGLTGVYGERPPPV